MNGHGLAARSESTPLEAEPILVSLFFPLVRRYLPFFARRLLSQSCRVFEREAERTRQYVNFLVITFTSSLRRVSLRLSVNCN